MPHDSRVGEEAWRRRPGREEARRLEGGRAKRRLGGGVPGARRRGEEARRLEGGRVERRHNRRDSWGAVAEGNLRGSGGDGRKTRARSGAAGTDGRTNIESVKRTKKSLL